MWIWVLSAAALAGAAPPGIETLAHQRVPMRDGIHLDTNVYLPKDSGRFPVILVRTPYGKGEEILPGYASFINHGYAVVVQDVRGRYQSEGVFDALEQEGPDGYDTLNWIGRQPWSNGRVGMSGGSYLGIAQWKVALLNNPYLKAIFPVVAGCDDYTDRFYSTGGAMKLGHRLMWLSDNLAEAGHRRPDFFNYVFHLPLRTSDLAATGRALPLYQAVLDHPLYDNYWKALSVREKLNRVRVPVFAVAGWYDNYAESDLEAFRLLSQSDRARGSQRIMVGPWPHNMSLHFNGVNLGDDSSAPIRAYQIEWYDHWLKGAPEVGHHHTTGEWHEARAEMTAAPVEIFIMGANRWRDEQEWPLARTRYTPFYLASGGRANSLRGDGALEWQLSKKDKPDTYVYDPRRPVPTRGGAVCCNPKVFPWGPLDQRPVEGRDDVLVYTSKPLTHDLEVTGPIRVNLNVSTSATDTDFTAKLVDVFPNGEARNLTDGILRLRYRAGLDKAIATRPGQINAITIDAGVTSNVFLAGHSIRLEIASSNFPRFDRNPNTGRAIADEKALKTVVQTVHHGRKYPSYIVLPIIPEANPAGVQHATAGKGDSVSKLTTPKPLRTP